MNKPIGIFDSGIGGLTVLKEVRREIPREDIVYFGDTAHVPYGTKSKEIITKYSTANMHFLQEFDVKLAIVACNTASALALEALKDNFHIPIIGVIEPGAKRALEVTRNGRVGVVGTRATIGSGSYETCLKNLDPQVKVYSESCPLFVPLVEEGWLEGEIVRKIARAYLDPLKAFGIDTLILGCTHYPLLESVIGEVMGREVRLVSSAEETAKEARDLLARLKIFSQDFNKEQETRFYVSDEPEQFKSLGERFLGRTIHSVAKVGDHVRGGSTR